jgi:hypothetical protein
VLVAAMVIAPVFEFLFQALDVFKQLGGFGF